LFVPDIRRLDDLPAFLTVPEAAAFLRLGRTACYEAVARGEIPSVKFGARLRVPRGALLVLARERLVDNGGEPVAPQGIQPSGRRTGHAAEDP
jgi:excisionase family DNA binding protein